MTITQTRGQCPTASLRSIAALLFTLVLAAASSVRGQSSKSDADAAWNSVKGLARASSAASASAVSLIDSADQLRAFYAKYPDNAQAKNAKCLEGLALTQAWLAGDESQSTRREQVVADVRHDKSVDTPLRAELYALSDSVAVAKTPGLTRDKQLLAYEQGTRALIAEFPSLPNGYEFLLHIAHDSAETRAPTLAREVAGLGAAPAWVRTEAQVMVNRFALVGQSLRQVTAAVASPDNPLGKAAGRPVLLYSWSKASTASLRRAKALAANADASAIVGVCLDAGDIEAARAQASAAGLPGDQVYDLLGARGAVAGKLVLTEPGLIYRTDAAGIIQSVSAQNDQPPPAAAGLDLALASGVSSPLLKMDPTKPAYPGILTSSDPTKPPPFPDAEKTALVALDAATAAIIPALRARTDAAHVDWVKVKGAGFHPNLTYLGGHPVMMLMVASDESVPAQTYRLGAIVDACAFMLQDSAFDQAVICLATYDAAHPEKMTTRNIEVKRDAFQSAVKKAGKSSTFATALAAVRADDSAAAVRQVCTELGIP